MQLKKRVSTSLVLLILATLTIVISELFFAFAIFIISLICYKEWCEINIPYFLKKKKDKMLIVKIFGLVYLLIFFTTSLFIYKEFGILSFIVIILLCSCSDIGGFIFGNLIGGKKLTKISPKKTVSGSIGSFLFSIMPLLLVNSQNFIDFNFDISIKNILFCFIVSFFCQIGDLIISYFKRLNKIKDSGSILPGHGGLLDRIDGLILATPMVFILKVTTLF